MSSEKPIIGVFDSGVGGQSMVNALQKSLPDNEIIYADDKDNVPYGSKTPKELFNLCLPIMQGLVDKGCRVIVVACNSVSTTIIEDLRKALPVPLIATEPMIKPAAEQTKSQIIAVCATEATLKSKRYAWLKENYAKDIKVLEPDCNGWAYMIENKQIDHEKIRGTITEVCEQGADVIVLGCTHYHWIEKEIEAIAKDFSATVIHPEQAIVARTKTILEQLS